MTEKYRGMRFDEGVRSDIMIEDKVILEMKISLAILAP